MTTKTRPSHRQLRRPQSTRRSLGLLAASAAMLVLAAVPVARAGTYDVYACDAAGGANNSWTQYNSYPSNLALEQTCPTQGNYSVGLVARTMVKPNAAVGAGTFAKWLFIAPPGASITNVSLNGWSVSGGSGWRRGLDSNAGNFWGWSGNDSVALGSPPNSPPYSPANIPISNATAVGFGLQCEWSSCNTYNGGGATAAKINFQAATVTVADSTLPTINANSGALWNDGWHRGYEEAWFAASDNVGVRQALGQVDGSAFALQDFNDAGWPNSVRCDYTFRKPCQDLPNVGVGFNTATVSDGAHSLRLAAMDAAGNYRWVDRTISVDNHTPGRPQNLAVSGGESWRQTNSFDVTWTNPDSQAAPITAARWRLCKDGTSAQCTTGTQSAQDIHQLSGLQAPGGTPGDYWLQVRLIDQAANEYGGWDDPAFVAGPVHLRFDNTPPGQALPDVRNGWISASEATEPERLQLGASETLPPSGIAGYAVTLDGSQPGSTISHPGAQAAVDLKTIPDGVHTLKARAISGSGVASAKVGQTTLRIDRQAPTVAVAGAPDPQQWNRDPVRFTLTAQDQPGLSGMDASPDGDVTHGAFVSYALDGAALERVPGASASLALAQDGRHTLTYRATDAAGNPSDQRTVSFKIDTTAPEVAAFDTQDPADPRLLVVNVADATSGVAGGQIEMRRQGAAIWDGLPTRAEPGRLVSYLDDHVPDGTYELRALVRDVAGNERVTDRRADGAHKQLTFPLRLASTIFLTARPPVSRCSPARAPAARAPGRSRCRARRAPAPPRLRALRLSFGATRRVYGQLTTAEGRAIPNALVDVLATIRGARISSREGSVRADAYGRFAYRLPAGPTRAVRFHYDGTNVVRDADSELVVQVPARSTLRASRRYMRVGQRVTFSGRVLGGHIPAEGKIIAIEAFDRGRWRTFATTRTTRLGGWAFSYRFEVSHGLYSYRFRVLVAREQAFPYETGYSRTATVTVQGP
ncbi:MAG: hypothetical protein QOJ97_231 [Solirubrobacteraceae bacterium]|jgi:hypothetical protein|nr:hypothetical protein [Solirubrobacteraceae bacterium]